VEVVVNEGPGLLAPRGSVSELGAIEDEIRHGFEAVRLATWALGHRLEEVRRRELHKALGMSFTKWVEERTPVSKGTASKLVQVVARLNELGDGAKEQLAGIEPLRLYPLRHLLKAEPDKAIELAVSKATEAELYDAAADALPEQHRSKMRLLSIPMPEELVPLWNQALNVARFWSEVPDPPPGALLEFMVNAIVQSDLPDGCEVWRAEVLNGGMVCRNFGTPYQSGEACGGWDRTQLQLICSGCGAARRVERCDRCEQTVGWFMCVGCHRSWVHDWTEFRKKVS
jgi:hypothetical protein